ncbi:Uroporphyrinogen-III synthase HemD-domain-containing protein [Naematelia encephala]|uniref:Uroporphyrinogen-III synthase HemD-domain-containing protein n=1 Tax=Naematelia encephala TaxID=71784 RepID=A0A1Y2ARF2_9TREE|nr:Uroporphyrinogen-III synthase HemD-domain-containing protein [Naematelia encephala]
MHCSSPVPRTCMFWPKSEETNGGPSHRTPIIIFKRPLDIIVSDPYFVDLYASGEYEPHFIPVLTETFKTDGLRDIISKGGAAWDGVIITSKRGAEAWIKACEEIEEFTSNSFSPRDGPSKSTADWSHTPLFAVGSTARQTIVESALSPSFRLNTSDPRPSARNSSQLVPLILDHPANLNRPYLILRGDKTLDEIPNQLRKVGRQFHQVEVYETRQDPDLVESLMEIKGRSIIPDGKDIWLAFFSPSSAGMVLPHLLSLEDELGPLPGRLGQTGQKARIKVLAIGETTRAWCEKEGIAVAAVAEQPNSHGVLQALKCVDAFQSAMWVALGCSCNNLCIPYIISRRASHT